jgi:hypothetical protein
VGCIADWFDWPLVLRLASSVPEVDVELVGPCITPPPQRLPSNVKVQAGCDHRALHAHLSRFTAGLIPFRGNRLTNSVDPIKYYDYRACGLPVLSTNFGEMSYRQSEESVFFLDGGANLGATVRAAISRSIPSSVTESFRQANSWEERFASASMFRALLGVPPKRESMPLQPARAA